jgi:hypothetical protein
MSKFYISIVKITFCLILLIITRIPANCQKSDATAVTLSASGWTITADPLQGHLTLYHDSLGILLKEITFNIYVRNELKPLRKWTAEKKGERQLSIQTKQPTSVWIFELNQNNVIISGTSSDLVLTAAAPASSERIVSRLLDPSGVPVNWTGTSEITVSWNGKETINPSNFPSRNPEVMTFGLGQVSATNLHSLFDRKSDIGIVFSESTLMSRDPHNDDLLKITMPVPGNAIVRLMPDYYTKTLGLPSYTRFDDSLFPSAPLIWGSWTAYYFEARESDIVSNADWLSANLKPYGFQYVQIDDGYDRGKEEGHYWIENWNKTLFPHGPEWIARYIKSKGLRPGIWLVPNSYAGAFEKHPDWYIYDKSGNVIKDYKTPALDYTNPAVQEWLKKLFSTLKGWGFEYYKFDGELYLPLYSPDVDQTKIFDKSIDHLDAYRKRLKLIRSVIGPETFVEGCVAGSPLNGIGFFNSVFNGADMYNSWKGCYAVFSSINANVFLNHIVTYVMPGEGIDVSPLMSADEAIQKMTPRAIEVVKSREDPFTGFGTTIAEARTLVSHVSLSGVAYPLTSILSGLPEERVRLLKMTMPTLPILPVDLYGRGSDLEWTTFKEYTTDTYIHNYPEILDLKVNARSGIYDVAAFTNWRSETVSKEISFSDKLGLDTGTPFVVFDFWNQSLQGVYMDKMGIDIESHDTRVLLIHPLKGHPQLIGNSRHISGAQSILDLNWDDSSSILSGTSETIKNDLYSLFVYVPEGMVLSMASAVTGDDHEVKVKSELDGNLLKMSFPGQQETVKWQVRFSGKPGNPQP